ncbi:hypothetical protein GQ44DRAFT_451363 [Phaeosphaeriaceae sp. PMI808]|nr:hypothetical protein GQ44DRAFT_451363 [Phaeosphaeriaceae sp. PMI808]
METGAPGTVSTLLSTATVVYNRPDFIWKRSRKASVTGLVLYPTLKHHIPVYVSCPCIGSFMAMGTALGRYYNNGLLITNVPRDQESRSRMPLPGPAEQGLPIMRNGRNFAPNQTCGASYCCPCSPMQAVHLHSKSLMNSQDLCPKLTRLEALMPETWEASQYRVGKVTNCEWTNMSDVKRKNTAAGSNTAVAPTTQ